MAMQQPEQTTRYRGNTQRSAPQAGGGIRRRQRGARATRPNATLTRALGWFSLGLGLSEIAAHQRLAKMIGVSDHSRVFPLLGAREIVSGLGILANRRPVASVRSRVAGDVIDLALLALAMNSPGVRRNRLAAATAGVVGVTLLDYFQSRRLAAADGTDPTVLPKDEAIRVEKSITVNRPVEECYRFWRDFQNLPRFMNHLESVTVIDAQRSHWVAKGPAGTTVEWDAELINDVPNEVIAWRSLDNAQVESTGAVRFEPARGGRGTVVQLKMHYRPPGGSVGAMVAKLFGEEPEQQVSEDFRRFKQVMETGEIATTTGQPHGHQPKAALRSLKGA
ncbi:MAG TPA: SRPBCC family protein [Terriglobales bacterium]|nr:SRPBCC family protein [Terriglobales bacterium]